MRAVLPALAHLAAATALIAAPSFVPLAPLAPAECPPRVIAPVRGIITDSFRPPACRWCAGNRGWEIEVSEPYVVVSSTDGVVSFAGTVANVAYVVVDTGCGLRITYGRLDDPRPFTAGQVVARGERVARSRTLFLGVRQGTVRLDPGVLWGVRRARLVSPTHARSAVRRAGGRDQLVWTGSRSVA